MTITPVTKQLPLVGLPLHWILYPRMRIHSQHVSTAWHKRADPLAAIDFGFHMNITHFDQKVADEIPGLPGLGITSLKVFTAYNDRLRLEDGEIFQVLRLAKKHNLLTMLHAENGDVIELLTAEALAEGHTTPDWHAKTRPAWGAVEAVLRGAALSAQADAPLYIVHMNVAGEVDQLRYAREHGLNVMGETCPQYLFFSADKLSRPDGAKWVCSPPLRTPADNKRLWEGLADGTIQTIGTDHCSFFYDGTQPIMYEGQAHCHPWKRARQGRFHQNPKWFALCGRSPSHLMDVRCPVRQALPQPVCRPDEHQSCQNLWSLPS